MKKYALTASALIACVALASIGQVALAAPQDSTTKTVPGYKTNQRCYYEHGAISPLTDPSAIRLLAQAAYIWALAPEFVYRFLNYNTLATAPVNKLGGSTFAAAWNNAATNAGDASVLYLNSMIDLSGKQPEGGTTDLVLTVPPSLDQYIVVDFLDQFINTVGSIGTRTTPSTETQTYLIAGPQSVYQHDETVMIGGKEFRVLPTDTNLNWMLIRILADTLAPSNASNSTANVYKNVVQKFALNTLDEYLKNGNQPIYQSSFKYTFTKEQLKQADLWHTQPTDAVDFFLQAGCSLVISPMPTEDVGFGGMPLADLPSWVAPQAEATTTYENPSYGQQTTLDLFRPLGLTENGYAVPRNWGTEQLNALQAGLEDGMSTLDQVFNTNPGHLTNYWKYLNANIGTYPNNPNGYQFRGAVVLAGGSANLAEDAVYAQTNNITTSTVQLSGNNAYMITFAAPMDTIPSVGTIPPLVLAGNGNPRGFWSIHVYQPDNSQSAAPFLMQSASLNTAYSSANLDVISVDPTADTITAVNTDYALMQASAPVFFSGSAAANYGLTEGQPYYMVADPTTGTSGTNPSITFQVSPVWRQTLSANNVPIQYSGAAGPVVDLLAGSGSFQWGPIQSVSQLGSQQITSGLMEPNSDGSYTIWVAPTLPAGADPHNWIPTPSSAYYNSIYGNPNVNTDIRLMMRMYYPAPGCPGPSILPSSDEQGMSCSAFDPTYVFPLVETVP
jgi:hypothetical protein